MDSYLKNILSFVLFKLLPGIDLNAIGPSQKKLNSLLLEKDYTLDKVKKKTKRPEKTDTSILPLSLEDNGTTHGAFSLLNQLKTMLGIPETPSKILPMT